MLVTTTDDDIPAIVALINRAYRGSGSTAAWNSEAGYISGDRTTSDLLRAEMLAKPEASLLKWVDAQAGGLLGCVWLEPLGDEKWYLGSLATDPDRQNTGLGRDVLDAAELWMRERGGTRVRITVVNVRETLIAWYLRRGYHLTGETEPFPYDDNRFGTPLRDDLQFVVLEKVLRPDDASVGEPSAIQDARSNGG